MKAAALVLGVVGSLLGLRASVEALVLLRIADWFGRGADLALGRLPLLLCVVGLVASLCVIRWARPAGVVMIVVGLLGLLIVFGALRIHFLTLSGPLLIIGGVLAVIAPDTSGVAVGTPDDARRSVTQRAAR